MSGSPPSGPYVLHARGLTQRYGSQEALRGVDLQLPAGSFTLLVGPNGAGKSTLLGVCQDLLPRSGGSLTVLGMDPAEEGARVRAALGVVPETSASPFPRLTVEETLELQARFRPSWDHEYARSLSRQLELRGRQRWARLSKGEARRVQLVAALAHRPPLLLLDEATDGLDPLARESVLALLAEHVAETGASVLYATHVLQEAQGLADHLVVLSGGRIRLQSAVETLRGSLFRCEVQAAGGSIPPGTEAPVVREVSRRPGSATWILRGTPEALAAWALEHGVELGPLRPLSTADAALAFLAGGAAPSAAPLSRPTDHPLHAAEEPSEGAAAASSTHPSIPSGTPSGAPPEASS